MFNDRQQAGRLLGERLRDLNLGKVVVFGLPRGGVVVAAEVAKILGAPLEVVVVRKIGAPDQPELALGAIAEGGVKVLDFEETRRLGYSSQQLNEVVRRERRELRRRKGLFRKGGLPDLEGRTALIVDDGLATGFTALAAVAAVKKHHPERVVFAAPVCARDSIEKVRGKVDDFVCLITPPDLGAIGNYYQDFSQVTDEEVIQLLESQPRSPRGQRR